MIIKRYLGCLIPALLVLMGVAVFIFYPKLPCSGFVVEVIDGDTIKLRSGVLLRYLGLNSPETKEMTSGSWVDKESYWGEKAYLMNKKLVFNKEIRIEYDREKKDKYKRLLGYVFVGDDFVNKNIIQNGLAVIDIRSPNLKYSDLFAKSFKNALDKKRGIWSDVRNVDLKEAHLFKGEVVAVEGKILDVYEGKRVYVFLMPSGFKLAVFKNNDLFLKGMDCMKLKGAKVKVYGMIRKYRKSFEIVIHHPYQLEVIE
ncbi:MAG: thermonuclease family protein [Candidatus Saelkia tenebricola]|nr:thermonuclease family protein [Candidatus Saelkia tenebricola]